MSRTLNFTVTTEYDGSKLLPFLRIKAGLSSRLVKSLKRVENGLVCNGEHIRTVDIIHTGDIISINIPDDLSEIEAKPFELDVIYEDDDILIVNKPPHLAMHPSHNHQGDTLANAVAYHLEKEGKTAVFRSIGRLDKDTSGVVVCALNSYSAARLTQQIKNKTINKIYYAIVSKEFQGEGTIDKPIYRPHPLHTYRAVGEDGDRAVTHWRAIESKNGFTLMKIYLETGRTHQIRVHFSYLGAALVGDSMYGEKSELIDRQALHCGEITLIHPVTSKKMSFYAELPEDMKGLLKSNIE
ncbi:MAG: RluA family pseudouridine synthase [Clostridiales bacterium]|nr:RluA family pseudouridine synthase [Clostridiales bacterium]